MTTKENERWTYHVCPDCGSWIRIFGSIKHGMGKCSNKNCENSELRKVEDFPTKFEHYVLNPSIHGCLVCGEGISILPQPYGKGGPDSYGFVGHFIIHNECMDLMMEIMEYESQRLEKEMNNDFGNKE